MTAGQLRDLLAAQPLMALTICSILLALGAGMVAAARPRLGAVFRNTAYLGLVAAGLLTVAQLAGHNGRSDAALWLDDAQPARVDGGETVIGKRPDGHFWVQASLNGVPVDFLVDTGATYTGVSPGVAARAGLMPDRNDAGVLLETANGTIVARMATAGSLRFGGIAASGLPVAIGPDNGAETNVIGMNLLSQLGGWRVEGNRLILTPKQR